MIVIEFRWLTRGGEHPVLQTRSVTTGVTEFGPTRYSTPWTNITTVDELDAEAVEQEDMPIHDDAEWVRRFTLIMIGMTVVIVLGFIAFIGFALR